MKGYTCRSYQLAMTKGDVDDLYNTINQAHSVNSNHPIIIYDDEFTVEFIISEKEKEKTTMTISENRITLKITLSEISTMLSNLCNRFENRNPDCAIMYSCTHDTKIWLEIFPLM